jgi:hypothetical protein
LIGKVVEVVETVEGVRSTHSSKVTAQRKGKGLRVGGWRSAALEVGGKWKIIANFEFERQRILNAQIA